MKRVYISGKITGIEQEACKLFDEAEEQINRLCSHVAINPMKLNHNHGGTWEEYMKLDLQWLLKCDAIFLLKNWEDSKGARIEKEIAEHTGMEIIEESKIRIIEGGINMII